jgi:hypothetical protein
MMNLLTLTGMALPLNAAMESRGGSTRGSSLTRRIIPKSMTKSALYASADIIVRVLISLIRNRGNCPCPRCLVPKSRFQNLGSKRDMTQRTSLARVHDGSQKAKISSARDIIYKQGYAVDGQAVDAVLKEESWHPNSVRYHAPVPELLKNPA